MGKGACPICNERFDPHDHVPMVSVACGHSICSKCVAQINPYRNSNSDAKLNNDDQSLSSSSSSGNDSPTHCPSCNRAFGDFVKNFDAIDALEVAESSRSQSIAPSIKSDATLRARASDFKHVADIDLVIERSRLRFSRDPASELGAGASGTVYVGRLDGTFVAIKSVRSTSDSWTTAERLRRELKLANRLKHPHIVEFRGAAWDDEMRQGTPRNVLLVSELMAGGNLRTALDATNQKGLAMESFMQIAIQIAHGLVYLHKEGLAHRDIKSANILLNEPLVPNSNRLPAGAKAKIADFGLSKYIDKVTGGGTVVQSIMEPGRLEATYAYLAPEAFGGDKTNVIRPDDDDDPRVNDMAKKRDIYAYGVLLWEMLTGRVPWAGVSLPDVYVRVCVRHDRPAPGLEDSRIPKKVRRLIERCWHQIPYRRPSASKIVRRLEEYTAEMMDASRSASASASASAAITNVTVGDMALPHNRSQSNHHSQNASIPPPTTQQPHSGNSGVFARVTSQGQQKILQNGKNGTGPTKMDGLESGDEGQMRLKRSHSAANPMREYQGENHDNHDNHPSMGNMGRSKKSGRSLVDDPPGSRQMPPSTSLPQNVGNATATARTATAAAIAERMRDGRGAAKNRIIREASNPNVGGDRIRRDISQPNRMIANHYDSDEEMRNFDPLKAYEEEECFAAVQEAKSNSNLASGSFAKNKISTSSSSNIISPRQHAPARRPSSPARRRPMSPSPHLVQQTTSSSNLKASHGEDTSHSLPRTMSRAASNSGADSLTARKSMKRNASARRMFERSSSQGPPLGHELSNVEPRSSNAADFAITTSGGGRKFIRKMRTNDPRPNKNTLKGLVPRSMSVGSGNAIGDDKKGGKNGEETEEVTVVTIGAPPKDDYMELVKGWNKEELLRNLAKRAHPMRLAGLAHAALSCEPHNEDEEVLRNGCAILHRLTVPSGSGESNDVHVVPAKEQLQIRRFLKTNQGVQVLLNALQPPRSRHATTLSYAMLALGNLTAWDLDAHKQFREADGVALVAKVMRTHSKNMGVYEKGCYTLACVAAAYSTKMKTVFRRCGAVDVVVSALSCVKQKNVTHDAVTKQACAALGAMCAGCPENAAHAAKSGAITYLIIAFETFRKNSRTESGKRSEMRLVCKAFMDIMCYGENRKIAGAQGGTNLIIRAMRIFRLDADFVEKVLSTLGEFCTERETAEQVVKIAGIDDIVAAMVRFRNSPSIQREGGRVLGLLIAAVGDEARRLMLHASGGERLVLALEKFGGGSDANAAVSIELCKALTALCRVESSVEGDVLGKRMRKLRCDKVIKNTLVAHRDNQNVQERGREALKQLGTLKSSGGFWSRLLSGARRR